MEEVTWTTKRVNAQVCEVKRMNLPYSWHTYCRSPSLSHHACQVVLIEELCHALTPLIEESRIRDLREG